MIQRLTATWGEGEVTITNANELRSLVDRVRNLSEPTMLFLKAGTGSTLVLGLGAKDSVLTFIEKDGTSLHSAGTPGRTGYLKFRCRDTVDDFHAEMAVSEAQAVDAAFEFMKTGELPATLRWERDW
jgi:hypothetical protein